MAFLNPSNQLIQIDTGNVLTYCWNPTASPISVYANIGEIQTLGQMFVGYSASYSTTNPYGYPSASNPAGSPAVYVLAKYLSTSATTLANWQTANAPAPVYWTDNTFTTVTGITTEGIGGTTLGLNFPAGYLMVNYASAPKLTLAQLLGGYVFVQVAGYLKGAYNALSGTAGIGNWIEPYAGTFSSQYIVSSTTAPTYQPFGRQLTAVASSMCDVLVNCDIF
jgi:hypothetical protein